MARKKNQYFSSEKNVWGNNFVFRFLSKLLNNGKANATEMTTSFLAAHLLVGHKNASGCAVFYLHGG